MWASGIIKTEIPADPSSGLRHAFVGVQIDLLIFDRPPEPKTLSRHAPRPSMEMSISAFFSTAVKSMEVNCDPLAVVNCALLAKT
jgi:hypothetical protein